MGTNDNARKKRFLTYEIKKEKTKCVFKKTNAPQKKKLMLQLLLNNSDGSGFGSALEK